MDYVQIKEDEVDLENVARVQTSERVCGFVFQIQAYHLIVG